MRTRTFGGRLALGGLMICAATTAAAQDSGFYGGADLGVANSPDRAHIQLGLIPLDADDIDNHNPAWDVHAGYRFSRYFALEIGALDLGGISGTLRNTSGGIPAEARAKFTARGPTLAAIGLLPFGKWSPFIEVGVLYQNVDLWLDGTIDGSPFTLHGEGDRDSKVYWGTGFGYDLNDRWRLRAKLNYYHQVGDDTHTGHANILAATAGLSYRF